MCEAKRIFNKKVIAFFIAIFLVNALIISSNKGTSVEAAYDEMVRSYYNNYDDSVSLIDGAAEAWCEYFETNDINMDDNTAQVISAREARDFFMKKVSYINNFESEIVNKIQIAQMFAQSGTYKDNSFEFVNLYKTQYDLKNIQKLDVEIGNGIWLEKIYKNNVIHLFSMLCCFITIYMFFLERKNGLYYIIHAAAKGRKQLFLKRCMIVSIQAFLVNAILYAEAFWILIHIYGGLDYINAPAASDEIFLLTSGSCTRIQFLVLIILFSSLATIVLSLLLWMILSFFSNINIGMFVFILIVGMEMFFYRLISVKTALKVLKFINIYYLLFPNKALEYYNWGYAWGITDVFHTTLILACIVGILALGINGFYTINKYFNGKKNTIERLLDRVFLRVMRIFENAPNYIKEIYKILISQKMAIIIIILLYISFQIQPGVGVLYDAEKSYMSGYYEKANGLQYNADLESLYKEYLDQYELFKQNIDYDGENAASVIANRSQLITLIGNNVNYIKRLNENGTAAVVLKPYEYMDSIGEKETDNQMLLVLLNVMTAIVISCGFISYEKNCLVHRTIMAYKNRKKWLLKKKAAESLLLIGFECITYGLYYYRLCQVYNYSNMKFPLKSLPIFEHFIINPSIIGFIIIEFIVKTLVLISIQSIMEWISMYARYIFCFVFGLISVMPQFMYMLGFEKLYDFSVGKYIAFYPCLMGADGEMRLYYIFVAGVFLIGICMFSVIMCSETISDRLRKFRRLV